MPRHNVHVYLSHAQAAYVADAIEADLASGVLTPGDVERANAVLARVERAVDKVTCNGRNCKCRRTPSEQRSNAEYRARLAAELAGAEVAS